MRVCRIRLSVPKTVKLASGHEMPVFSLGTWKAKPGVTGEVIGVALKCGYRGIDAANDYNNEPEVGEAIKKAIEDGVVKRDELFVQCKLWNSNHRAAHVPVDLERSLEDLQLDYVDSYVIHWPQACPATGQDAATRTNGAHAAHYSENPMFPMDENMYLKSDADCHYIETWQAMEKLVDEGKCKSIGLSNFNKKQVEEVVAAARIPVSTVQNECHPYFQQKDLIDCCRYHNIHFQAFSPLGSGETNLQVAPPPTGTIPLNDKHLMELAAKYEKNVGQIILRWMVQKGITFVSKSSTPARIEANFAVWDWELTAEDMLSFDKLNCGWRHLHWRETAHHRDYPFFDELPYGYTLEKVTNLAPGQ